MLACRIANVLCRLRKQNECHVVSHVQDVDHHVTTAAWPPSLGAWRWDPYPAAHASMGRKTTRATWWRKTTSLRVQHTS